MKRIASIVREKPMLAVLPAVLAAAVLVLAVRGADLGRDSADYCPKQAPVVNVTYTRDPIRYDDSFDGKTLYDFSRKRSFQAITLLSPYNGWLPEFFLGKKDVPLSVVMRTYPAQGKGMNGRVCVDYGRVTIHAVQKSVGFIAKEVKRDGHCYAGHKASHYLLDEASVGPISRFTDRIRGAMTAHVMATPPRGPYTKSQAERAAQEMIEDLRRFVKPHEEVMTESLYNSWKYAGNGMDAAVLAWVCQEEGVEAIRGRQKVRRD